VSHPLRALGRSALQSLAEALMTGHVAPPFTRAAVAQHVPDAHQPAVAAALAELDSDGMAPRHIARALRLLVEERDATQQMNDRVELVCSPPEMDTVHARDTSVVVNELFRRAKSTVLIATYALDEKKKAESLFGELADRMDREPALHVRVIANVHRSHDDDRPAEELVREFREAIRQRIWPGQRLPEVFYDPRSVEPNGQKRAVMHAKAIVADGRYTLLTSANFTEAAQERNIEAGVLLDDRRIAARVTRQFERFVEKGDVVRL